MPQSPVLGIREDYSQYTVRGHYIKTPELQAYFRAMMWFGRITLHFSDDAAARQWRDWRWQMRHCVRDIPTFERLLGVNFAGKERRDLELTVADRNGDEREVTVRPTRFSSRTARARSAPVRR